MTRVTSWPPRRSFAGSTPSGPRSGIPGADRVPNPLILLFCLLAAATGCSRAVNVGTAPSPVFAIAVTNSTGEEMIVSYDDGSGRRALGAVAAGATDRFVIAQPARTTVDITARNSAGTRSVGPIPVALVAGETRPVTLR